MTVVHRFLKWIKRLVGWSVAVLLAWMVVLALVQVILRWFFSIGISWADQQLRQLVLWVGLLGGVMAAVENRHIRIDLLEHYFNKRIHLIIGRMVSIIAGIGSIYLGYISIGFIASEKGADLVFDNLLFGAPVPVWIVELIIPTCFWLIGLFFLIPIADMTRPAKGA